MAGLIRKRLEEARKEGRLINPVPLVTEIKARRKRILVKEGTVLDILVSRSLDFMEMVGAELRSLEFWSALTSLTIAAEVIGRLERLLR